MIKSGRYLGRFLGPLLKTGLPVMENVLQLLAKIVLMPLGLTTAALAAYTGMQKKIPWLRNYKINNIKQRNERHYENNQVSGRF